MAMDNSPWKRMHVQGAASLLKSSRKLTKLPPPKQKHVW